MNPRLLRLLLVSLLAALLSSHAAWAQTKSAPAFSAVRGKLQAVTSDSLTIQTPSGVVQVKIKQPLTTYVRTPSDLSHVTPSSYVGVASVKQANGTEVAKQINIFPAALRGLGEGSFMLPPAPGAATQSRMTNGAVSGPSKTASSSRMTNGTVQKPGGKTIVVHYKDGSQTVSVPPDVEVTEIVPKKVTLAVGDTVNAAAEKQADGTLTTNKVYQIAANTGSK
jgi:hypothetical protein